MTPAAGCVTKRCGCPSVREGSGYNVLQFFGGMYNGLDQTRPYLTELERRLASPTPD